MQEFLVDRLLLDEREKNAEEEYENLASRASLLRESFIPAQLTVHEDPHPFKVICTPRRVGKSGYVVRDDLIACAAIEDCLAIYTSVTVTQAKRNVWGLINRLNERYHLGGKPSERELYMSFPNGSRYYLGGALTQNDVDRWRGVGPHRVKIDEGASHDDGTLRELLDDVFIPALMDNDGELALCGTPSPVLAGMFWEASDPKKAFDIKDGRANARPYAERHDPRWDGVEFLWSYHTWSQADNTAVEGLWERSLRLKRMKGYADDDPTWLREYMGIWVADGDAFVFRYDGARNAWEPDPTSDNVWGLPRGHRWRFGLVIDEGYDDALTGEVFAACSTSDKMYHLPGFRERGATVTGTANHIKALREQFGGQFDYIIFDTLGLGKKIAAELAEVHGIHVTPAKHNEKREHIDILNNELWHGRFMVRKGSVMEKQMRTLQWKDPKTRRQEHPRQPNDSTDCAVYGVRHSPHRYYRTPPNAGPKRGTHEWYREQERQQIEKLAREDDLRSQKRYGDLMREKRDEQRRTHGQRLRVLSSVRKLRT